MSRRHERSACRQFRAAAPVTAACCTLLPTFESNLAVNRKVAARLNCENAARALVEMGVSLEAKCPSTNRTALKVMSLAPRIVCEGEGAQNKVEDGRTGQHSEDRVSVAPSEPGHSEGARHRGLPSSNDGYQMEKMLRHSGHRRRKQAYGAAADHEQNGRPGGRLLAHAHT
eukprot:57333-Pelagomonas_calceolata.AAC.1